MKRYRILQPGMYQRTKPKKGAERGTARALKVGSIESFPPEVAAVALERGLIEEVQASAPAAPPPPPAEDPAPDPAGEQLHAEPLPPLGEETP